MPLMDDVVIQPEEEVLDSIDPENAESHRDQLGLEDDDFAAGWLPSESLAAEDMALVGLTSTWGFVRIKALHKCLAGVERTLTSSDSYELAQSIVKDRFFELFGFTLKRALESYRSQLQLSTNDAFAAGVFETPLQLPLAPKFSLSDLANSKDAAQKYLRAMNDSSHECVMRFWGGKPSNNKQDLLRNVANSLGVNAMLPRAIVAALCCCSETRTVEVPAMTSQPVKRSRPSSSRLESWERPTQPQRELPTINVRKYDCDLYDEKDNLSAKLREHHVGKQAFNVW